MAKTKRQQVSGLVAVWRCGHFPYFLGGHVVEVREYGRVKTKEFGNAVFKPVLILQESEGEGLLKELKELRGQHDAAAKAFNATWRLEVDKVLDYFHTGLSSNDGREKES